MVNVIIDKNLSQNDLNTLECWVKNRDAGVKDIVTEIMDAIKSNKVMVLLYSKNSKNSNYVNN